MSETPSRPALCEYFPGCNACQLWDVGYSAQRDLKVRRLKELLTSKSLTFTGPIDFVSSGEYGLRDRIDFTFRYDSTTGKTVFGFYDSEKRLISIVNCLQMSAQLQKIYEEFVSVIPKTSDGPILRGSVRLRRGLNGLKGCWLDLSNLDIKHLLEDAEYLRSLLDLGFKIEMGQKGKSVSDKDGKLMFKEPVAYPWFKTFTASGNELALNCLISDFTQPSWTGARSLTDTVLSWVSQIKTKSLSVIEFGPGIGQFTVPLLAEGIPVKALEIDTAACENLRLNASGFAENLLEIVNDDFQRRAFSQKSSLVLVNPARSGLKKFTESIQQSDAGYLIYVSCFPESMCEDLAALKTNYQIKEIKIVDQFPQTNHFESCVLLQKIK